MQTKHLQKPTAFPVGWRPLGKVVSLPPTLQDLTPLVLEDRVMRFWSAVSEDRKQHLIEQPLFTLLSSYKKKAERGVLPSGAWEEAVRALTEDLGPLFPKLIGETIGAMVARPNPYQEDSILRVQEFLPAP